MRRAGFTLVEILVVMALISVLMGIGIGMYSSMASLGQATQAKNTVIDAIQSVKRASMTSRAALVVDPKQNLVYGLQSALVAMSNFEPNDDPVNDPANQVVGLGYKHGVFTGDGKPEAYPLGHTGGGFVSAGGVVIDFGNWSDYDLREGIDVDIWFYPTENRSVDLVTKGDSYGILLKRGPGGPTVVAYLSFQEGDEFGKASSKEQFAVEQPLVMNRWNRVQLKYDRNVVTVNVDSYGRGAVERVRKEEKRAIAPDTGANLTIGSNRNPMVGRVDDFKVSGILSGELKPLPEDVAILGKAIKVHFRDGKLDPAEHTGSVTLKLMYQGVESDITIGVLGNILVK